MGWWDYTGFAGTFLHYIVCIPCCVPTTFKSSSVAMYLIPFTFYSPSHPPPPVTSTLSVSVSFCLFFFFVYKDCLLIINTHFLNQFPSSVYKTMTSQINKNIVPGGIIFLSWGRSGMLYAMQICYGQHYHLSEIIWKFLWMVRSMSYYGELDLCVCSVRDIYGSKQHHARLVKVVETAGAWFQFA